jgi:hypothetical protein
MKYLNLVFCLVLCAQALQAQTVILHGDTPSAVEVNAANDLKADIQHAYPNEVVYVQDCSRALDRSYARIFIVGTPASNSLIQKQIARSDSPLLTAPLAAETFVLQTLPFGDQQALYIIGADDRGTYYGVYEFASRVLGIDALEYWTGKTPQAPDVFELPELSFREQPPVFPRRGYFDNDNDMLANWKGRKLIVELDTWKEMINSLSRMRYNYIDLHDTLGRPEFYEWDYYKNMVEYHTDLELVDQVIDYAHSKGMMVQIPMYLGWEFYHMDFDKVSLSKHHDHWMEVYEYYLTQTPLAKADMFLARPRDPVYDRAYKSEEEKQAGIKPGPLMTKMFAGLKALIDQHCPGSILVCDLWREGRPMWKSGSFAPEKQVQMLWADHYGGDFKDWPQEHKGYDFGIYIHAGVWKNHVIQDPLVHKISAAIKEAVSREMTHNIFVNGQDFKHFILNLEVCARAAWDAEGFDPDAFYTEWTSRYFGTAASDRVVKSLKLLNAAHIALHGYKEITNASVISLNSLESGKIKISRLGAEKKTLKALQLAEASLQTAVDAASLVPPAAQLVYDDQIVFPATIYVDNIRLLRAVVRYAEFVQSGRHDPATYEQLADHMRNALVTMRTTLDEGSRWKKWDGWTNCDNFRVYTPPPSIEAVERIIEKYRAW